MCIFEDPLSNVRKMYHFASIKLLIDQQLFKLNWKLSLKLLSLLLGTKLDHTMIIDPIFIISVFEYEASNNFPLIR